MVCVYVCECGWREREREREREVGEGKVRGGGGGGVGALGGAARSKCERVNWSNEDASGFTQSFLAAASLLFLPYVAAASSV